MILALAGEGSRPVVLLMFQNLLSLFAIGTVFWVWAWWARPWGRQWVWAVLCALTFPAQLIYANAIMSEIMLQAVVLALLAACLAYIKTLKLIYFFVIAGTVVTALLLKPVFYPFAGFVGIMGLIEAWRMKHWKPALVGLLPVLAVVAYMEWNYQRTGYFHFSSITDINMLHYNAAGVVRQLNGPEAEEAWVAGVLREAHRQPDFAARQQLIQQRAGAVLRAHSIVYAKQHILGMVTFFLDPGRFDLSEFMNLAPLAGGGLLAQVRTGGLWAAVQRLPWGLLVGLGAVLLANAGRLVLAVRGFLRLRGGPGWVHYGRWVAFGLLGYVALLTGPLGAARFLVPVWPLLLGLALAGIKSRKNAVPPTPATAAANE
ncbi:hypothetical protein [Hymenobacter negativus]|uniref:Glycosyltransferase RgtA/B/C/D-like domain-containing protein n=1 Tax=Hymenobacter negativus TaxID=2795026 RepID=A0ABS3QKI1_9BACT|nr:hypothetical protein [Hymenobacter negativus]MBO2011759.1 hypothetical protein [Hymenobacter negativus]